MTAPRFGAPLAAPRLETSAVVAPTPIESGAVTVPRGPEAPPSVASTPAQLAIAITVITYRRPTLLAALLASLAAQRVPAPARITIVVVDNDAAGSAGPIVAAARGATAWPLVYAIEPRRNIAAARNRAVAIALADAADYVAFIDDDERAMPEWLAQLILLQRETGADVVTGPIAPIVHADAPCWATPALFTDSRPRPSGTWVPTAITSNALVSAAVLRTLDGPFDEVLGLSGGSDSHLFLRATQRGARIVWANEAVTEEAIGADRTTLNWVARRAFREGNAAVFIERELVSGWWVKRLAKSAARLATAAGLASCGIVRDRRMLAVALRQLCLACGSIAGTLGYRYFEYRTPRPE